MQGDAFIERSLNIQRKCAVKVLAGVQGALKLGMLAGRR